VVCVCVPDNRDVTHPFLTNVAGPRITAQTHATPMSSSRHRKTCLFFQKAKLPRNSAPPTQNSQLILARSPELVVALGLLGPELGTTPGVVTTEDGGVAPHIFRDVVVGPETAAGSVVVMSPMTSTVEAPAVPIDIGTVPTVIATPGARVWPATMYCVVPSTRVVAI
jgi:hypothetical protein